MVGRSKEELSKRLEDYVEQRTAPGLADGRRVAAAAARVGFVFSGQGPQWYGMGRELLAKEPIFREVIAECDALLRPLSGWSLLEELGLPQERSRLDQTAIAQPALFALQVALAALWKSWGVAPDAVVGHSVGEIAALHVAGVLDLPEAVRIVWHRGRIMQQATGLGRMASVGLTEAEATELVAPYGDRLGIAAVNAPRSVVLSGEAAALEAALGVLTAREVSHRMLPVQYAFHSAQMAPFQAQLAEQLGDVRAAASSATVYSTVTGGLAKDLRFDATYFGRNVRDPVRFASCINAMAEDGCNVFIEIGPQPVLASSIAECHFCARTRAGGFGVIASRPAGARNFVAGLCWRLCRWLRSGLGERPADLRPGCRAAGLSMAAKAPLAPSTPGAQRRSAGSRTPRTWAPNSSGRDRGGDF